MRHKIRNLIFRNEFDMYGQCAAHRQVNLEYWNKIPNIGDALSPVIVSWMLQQRGLTCLQKVSKTRHLFAVGSILGFSVRRFDATVWGSGIKDVTYIDNLSKWSWIVKLDIRAVRGPITRDILNSIGYHCPCVYGDPAVLVPFIYPAEQEREILYPVAAIHHWKYSDEKLSVPTIDVRTDNYELFIDQILKAEKIISSSLHGIILAEAYGVPAVFVNEGMSNQFELLKVYDWYYSTGRYDVVIAPDMMSALDYKPMPLPDLHNMQRTLLNTFPYDLWS